MKTAVKLAEKSMKLLPELRNISFSYTMRRGEITEIQQAVDLKPHTRNSWE